MNMDVINF